MAVFLKKEKESHIHDSEIRHNKTLGKGQNTGEQWRVAWPLLHDYLKNHKL